MASTPLPASATTRRPGSRLMMFATPVRRSAWSSTNSTLAVDAGGVAASTGDMDLRWHRRRVPRQDDFGPVSRCGDDGQRRADAVGAFLHARHAEARLGRL